MPLIGRTAWEIFFNQSKALPRSGVAIRHQYGISALVSQTSFAGKPVVASRNIGCFLRLGGLKSVNINFIENSESIKNLHDMIYQFD